VSAELPLIVGSRDQLQLTVYDSVGGQSVVADLTGATVLLRAQVGAGTVKSWPADIDPDQVGSKGRCTYELGATDLDRPGRLVIQAIMTVGGKAYRSQYVERAVLPAL